MEIARVRRTVGPTCFNLYPLVHTLRLKMSYACACAQQFALQKPAAHGRWKTLDRGGPWDETASIYIVAHSACLYVFFFVIQKKSAARVPP